MSDSFRRFRGLFAKRPENKGPKSRLLVESLEERAVPANVIADYQVTQDWGSGFQGAIRLENAEPTVIEDWTLEFDFAAEISSIWDARIVSHVGTHYLIEGAGWNNDLARGGVVSFGFVAGPDGSAEVTNLLLNGEPLGPGDPQPQLPTLIINDITANESDGIAQFTLQLSAASTDNVSASFITVDGSAVGDVDYQPVSGSVNFAPGETTKIIEVPLIDDDLEEIAEAFALQIDNVQGAQPDNLSATATLVSNETPPSTAAVTFSVDSDWQTGFTGTITITNEEDNRLTNWTLEFDFAGTISSIWNAEMVSQDGHHFTVKPASWNQEIPAGASVHFGFVGSPGGNAVAPTSFSLNGTDVTDPPPPPPPSPPELQANDDFLSVGKNQSATINVLANDSYPAGAVTVSLDAPPQNGTVDLNSNGTILYTPNSDFVGTETFLYTITDSAGDTTSATVTITVSDSTSIWPEHVFAPYVDMLLYPTFDLVSAAQEQGIQFFTLAFITAGSQGQATWGGYDVYSVGGGSDYETNVQSQISQIRDMGGDLMISFGGATGIELADSISDVNTLQAEYQKVIDAYQLTRVDFDIEGAAILHTEAVDRRSQAIAGLQAEATAEGRELYVSFTLPVLPTGLTPGGLYVLESALNHGVHIDEVNIMAMDYGDSAAPNPDGQMGEYAIQAATSLFNQLQVVYNTAGIAKTDDQLWHTIAVTPMIGLNDVTTETFYLQDAQELLDFAQEKGLTRLSMWSLNRDRYQSGVTYVSPTSSSIMQDPFAFAQVFIDFMDGTQ